MCGFFESNVQLGGGEGEGERERVLFEECFFDLEDWSFNYKSHLCIVKCTWKPVITATIPQKYLLLLYIILYLSQ